MAARRQIGASQLKPACVACRRRLLHGLPWWWCSQESMVQLISNAAAATTQLVRDRSTSQFVAGRRTGISPRATAIRSGAAVLGPPVRTAKHWTTAEKPRSPARIICRRWRSARSRYSIDTGERLRTGSAHILTSLVANSFSSIESQYAAFGG